VLKTKPMYMFLNMLFQHLVEPRPTEPAPAGRASRPGRQRSITTMRNDERMTITKENEMAWGESKAWMRGTASGKLYQALLDDALNQPVRNAKRKKIVHPEEMPWEMSGRACSASVERADEHAHGNGGRYMQIVPPGAIGEAPPPRRGVPVRRGRPRFDLHQDCDVEITDTYHWKPQAEVKRYEWEAGDVIYIPPNTIHQHFKRGSTASRETHLRDQPHLQILRIERPRAIGGRA